MSTKLSARQWLWGYPQGKSTSNKTSALTKSMNMDICVVGTSNQVFIRDSQTETKLKTLSSYWKNAILCDRFILYSHFCFNIGFWQSSFVWQCCVFNLSNFNWKPVLQFFEEFRFSEFFFSRFENVENFKWLSHNNMLVCQTEGCFENP